jgi:hypothetical protein
VTSRATRLLIGLGYGAAATLMAYALVRGVERAFFPEPNPAALIWSGRSPFVWRALDALHAGGAAVFGGYALAAARPEIAARWLARAFTLAIVAVVLVTVIAP